MVVARGRSAEPVVLSVLAATSTTRKSGTFQSTGEPVSRMLPRSLMVPPGFPEFPSRRRLVSPGPCLLEGRAWSGVGELTGVEVSTDGGESWTAAELEDDVGSPWAWRRWTFEWDATAGEHELCCRARDAAGNEQPLEPAWKFCIACGTRQG